VITLMQVRPYTGDTVVPSPNHGPRRAQAIEGIVLHATQDAGNESWSLSWMRSPKSSVSCHLLVGRTGRVTRLVGDQQRAWHAGLSLWRGTRDVNSITLGIEIANRNDGEPFTDAQYIRVAEIVAHYCSQGLSLDAVVSHAQVAAGRRTDPLGWDWERFRALVLLQLWPADNPAQPILELSPTVSAVTPQVTATPKPRARANTSPKPVLHSRTLWLNGMLVLASGGALIGDALDLAHRVGIILPEDITKWALFGVGLINILLRLRSTQPLTCSQGALNRPVHFARGARA
jgi:N-acetylmuramoyl-L-alanine amidase